MRMRLTLIMRTGQQGHDLKPQTQTPVLCPLHFIQPKTLGLNKIKNFQVVLNYSFLGKNPFSPDGVKIVIIVVLFCYR